MTRNRDGCFAWSHIGGSGFSFLSPDRDLVPLGKGPIMGRSCSSRERVFVGRCGAGGISSGTRVLQYRSLSASPVGCLQGRLE